MNYYGNGYYYCTNNYGRIRYHVKHSTCISYYYTVDDWLLSCSCLSWDQMEVIMRQMETYWLRQMFWPMTVLLGTPNIDVSVNLLLD